jgi:hypothetical protein
LGESVHRKRQPCISNLLAASRRRETSISSLPAPLPIKQLFNSAVTTIELILPLNSTDHFCAGSQAVAEVVRQVMLFAEEDAPALKTWIVKRIENT